jgi:hypothetical protein
MKKLLLQMLLGLMAFSSQLSAFLGNDAGPLCERMWGLQAKGGVAPTYYSKSDHIELAIPVPSTIVVSGGRPSFSEQFSTPYDIGLEIDWNWNARLQLFAEGGYNRAKGKTFHTILSEPVPSELNFMYTANYEVYSAYLGAKYYFSTRWDNLASFIGGKLGYLYQKHGFTDAYVFGVLLPNLDFSHSKNGVSGGVQLGLEWWLNKHLSLVLTGEVVISQGLGKTDIIDVDNEVLTRVVYKSSGMLISTPIILGVRFGF